MDGNISAPNVAAVISTDASNSGGLGFEAGYAAWGYSLFSSVPQNNFRDKRVYLKLGHDTFSFHILFKSLFMLAFGSK
jgi:hypothetical protein